MTSETRRKRPHQDQRATLIKIEAEIERVKARDERRLIRAAEKEGFFAVQSSQAQMREMFRAELDGRLSQKDSGLLKLQRRKSKTARDLRAKDAQRKAILGAFIVAQCRHKPELHASIQEDVRNFLWRHPDKGIAAGNIALLSPFFDDARHTDTSDLQPTAPGTKEPEHRRKLRTRRLILLGAWVLDQCMVEPLRQLVAAELDTFLQQDAKDDRKRALLSDVLRATRTGISPQTQSQSFTPT